MGDKPYITLPFGLSKDRGVWNNAEVIVDIPQEENIKWFLTGLNLMMSCER